MSSVNPIHVEQVMDLANKSPYFKLLGMKLEEMREGYCKVVVDVEKKHLNAFGGIHGGAYASLIDTAAYWALYCELEEEAGFITLDLCVNNLRAVREGRVVVEGRVIKRGRSISLCEAEAYDEQGRLLAHGTSKQFLSPTLQPISAAVKSLDSQPLAPKFLP